MQGNIKDSLFRPEVLKRVLIYGLLTLFLGCLQCAFFPLLDFVPCTPDLILCMLIAIALLDNEPSAMVCAVGAGFYVDAIGGAGIALSPLVYFIAVILISLFTGKILKSLPSYLLLLLPSLLWRTAATYICIFINSRALPPFAVFKAILLPEVICTAICAIPIYFLLKLCTKPLQTHGKFTF